MATTTVGMTFEVYNRGGPALAEIDRHLSKLRGTLNTFGAVTGLTLGTAVIVREVRSWITAAEEAEKVNRTFTLALGDNAAAAEEWANRYARSADVCDIETKKFLSSYALLAEEFGATPNQALAVSEALTRLTNDMASFARITPEEAFGKIQSALQGSARGLRQLGVHIDDAAAKEYALRQGWIRHGEELSSLQQFMAGYNVLLDHTGIMQGDLSRSAGSAADEERRLREEMADIREELGKTLLPVYRDALKEVHTTLSEHKADLRDIVAGAGEVANALLHVLTSAASVTKAVTDAVWNQFDKIQDIHQGVTNPADLGQLPLPPELRRTAQEEYRLTTGDYRAFRKPTAYQERWTPGEDVYYARWPGEATHEQPPQDQARWGELYQAYQSQANEYRRRTGAGEIWVPPQFATSTPIGPGQPGEPAMGPRQPWEWNPLEYNWGSLPITVPPAPSAAQFTNVSTVAPSPPGLLEPAAPIGPRQPWESNPLSYNPNMPPAGIGPTPPWSWNPLQYNPGGEQVTIRPLTPASPASATAAGNPDFPRMVNPGASAELMDAQQKARAEVDKLSAALRQQLEIVNLEAQGQTSAAQSVQFAATVQAGYGDAVEEGNARIAEYNANLHQLADAKTQAYGATVIANLTEENRLLTLTDGERERSIAQTRVENELKKLGGQLTTEQTATIRELLDAQQQLNRTRAQSTYDQALQEEIAQMQFELTLLDKSAAARERELAVHEKIVEAERQGLTFSAAQQAEYEKTIETLQKARGEIGDFWSGVGAGIREMNANLETAAQLGGQMIETFGEGVPSAIWSAITATESWEDAFKRLGLALAEQAFTSSTSSLWTSILSGVVGAFAGSGFTSGWGGGGSGYSNPMGSYTRNFAAGTVVSAAGLPVPTIVHYARGMASGNGVAGVRTNTVIDRSTLFPLADGRTAQLGEAGPEAIVPVHPARGGYAVTVYGRRDIPELLLTRGPDGKLGLDLTHDLLDQDAGRIARSSSAAEPFAAGTIIDRSPAVTYPVHYAGGGVFDRRLDARTDAVQPSPAARVSTAAPVRAPALTAGVGGRDGAVVTENLLRQLLGAVRDSAGGGEFTLNFEDLMEKYTATRAGQRRFSRMTNRSA